MKTNILKSVLLFLTLCINLTIDAQVSDVVYNSNNTGGSLTLLASDCQESYFSYYWEIDVPVNTPIKVTTTLNYYFNLMLYTYNGADYTYPFDNYEPSSTTKTIVSSDGKIYVYCDDFEGISIPTSNAFTITFQVDNTFSINENLYVKNGNLITNNVLKVISPSGSIEIGPKNPSWAHIYTDMPKFIFNKPIHTITGEFSAYNTTNLSLQTNSVTRMTILNSNGNVGIGVTNPQGVLQASGTGDNSWIYFNPNAGTSLTTKFKPKVPYGMAFTWNYSGGNGESIINYSKQSGSSPRLDFTSYDGTNLITEMTLKNGSLGIGTTTPGAKLEVKDGSVLINYSDAVYTTINTLGNKYQLIGSYQGWDKNTIYIAGYNYSNNSTYSTKYISFGGPIANGVGEKMFINLLTGKVGIGTTTPDSLLTVKGGIHARSVVIDFNGSLADYVFDPTYNLMPLTQVEQFVNTNKHLPSIPSATEVQEKGMNMGEMQNKLLQKIEELTLYVIQQQKEIDALREEIKRK